MTRKSKTQTAWWLAVLACGAGLIIFYFHKQSAQAEPRTEAETSAPTVAVARVTREDLSQVVTIPAEFRAYMETEMRAKESGYIGKMSVDFGDRVKAGQLLATIEVPELADQLNNALATEQRAQADYTNAHLMYTRIMTVNHDHPNLVAQQDVDTATSKDLTAQAAIAAARAEVSRYQTLAAYTNIVAPFDGIVTHRYLDQGALVEERSDVLKVSDNFLLRLDFPVSLKYVRDIRVGDVVDVVVESLGGKKISGKITRATWLVNDETRTMMTEIEVANPDLELVPGMYARVAMQVNQRAHALAIPVEALPAGQSNSVYVVNAKNEIEERDVTVGVETPVKYEVLSGLQEGESVILGSRSRIKPGEQVTPKTIEPLAVK